MIIVYKCAVLSDAQPKDYNLVLEFFKAACFDIGCRVSDLKVGDGIIRFSFKFHKRQWPAARVFVKQIILKIKEPMSKNGITILNKFECKEFIKQ